jgi:hypothetical protein
MTERNINTDAFDHIFCFTMTNIFSIQIIMTKSTYAHLALLFILTVTATWFGSISQKTEHYNEVDVVTQVNSIPLWKGTKDDRALTSQV